MTPTTTTTSGQILAGQISPGQRPDPSPAAARHADATPALPPAREAALRQAAQAFEASFLAEMLKTAGLNRPRASMGGGAGEEAFASLLVGAQAEALAKRGGIGLAEPVYRSLLAREPTHDGARDPAAAAGIGPAADRQVAGATAPHTPADTADDQAVPVAAPHTTIAALAADKTIAAIAADKTTAALAAGRED